MTVIIALLQGVNIGKNKRIAMSDFKQIITDLGGANATTLVNSGNIVFGYHNPDEEMLREEIEHAVSEHVGLQIPTIIRSSVEMTRILEANPYPHVDDPTCLHVDFLNIPAPNALDDLDFGEDHLTMLDREIYLHLPNKMSGSTYDAKTLGKRLGTHHTSRNWNTVTKLAHIASNLE